MRRILASAITIILVLSVALNISAAQTGDEQTIRQLVGEWLDALVKNDLARLDRIIADDYIITTSDGSVLSKTEDLAPLKAGLKIESATTEDLKVRVYGSAAVVTGTGIFKGSFNGRPFNTRERFTDTWLKREGRWQAVASQSCALRNQTSETQSLRFAREQLLEDFEVARRALEEGHSGIYRYTSKAELDSAFDLAAKSLDRPMDAYEFFRVMAPVVARIKCGHTSVALPADVRQELNTRAPVLPLQVKVLDKKPYVFRDFSSADRKLAGMEIVSINGVPASKIIATMLAAVPADGDVESSRQVRISGNFNGSLITLLGLKSPYDLVLRDAKTKQEQKAHLEGIEVPKLQTISKEQYPQDQFPERAGEMKFLDNGQIGLMKINGFGGTVDPEKKKGLREFYKESFEEIQAKGAKSLIIDLRNNGGGEDELGKLLLSYLIDQPFKYYDDLVLNNNTFSFAKYMNRPDFKIPEKVAEQGRDGKYHAVSHPNWGINQPSKPTFTGKVFILIDGGSFSTTSEFLSQVHFHKRATFIGEESAGGYYGNSSGFMPALTLPNTKLVVRVPLMTYYMAVSGYKAASHGVVPDYPVARTIQDLIAGTDRDMELALGLARKL